MVSCIRYGGLNAFLCLSGLLLWFFFFFSSRRRHTRFDCDWSSDVCSSDLAGRGRLNLWTVFGLTWAANVASASLVYWLARRYGRDFFKGPTGRRLLTPPVLAHIEAQYQRHGTYGIFVSRLLPILRAVVPPFAGLAGLSAPRALIPLALASALWYGLLTVLVASLGTNLDAVVAALAHVNWVLGAAALGILIFLAVWIVRRLKR